MSRTLFVYFLGLWVAKTSVSFKESRLGGKGKNEEIVFIFRYITLQKLITITCLCFKQTLT